MCCTQKPTKAVPESSEKVQMYEGHRFCAESLEKPDTVESIGKTKLEQEPGKKKIIKKEAGDKAQDSGTLH